MHRRPTLALLCLLLTLVACSRVDHAPSVVIEQASLPAAPTAAAALVLSAAPSPATASSDPPTPAPEGSPGPSPAPPRVHTVRAGETIHGIATLHGTTAAALVSANGLRGSRLGPGQELRIPDGAAGSARSATGGTGVAVIIERGTATRRSVALTFDAGADRGYAELVLDVLAENGVRASFGMTGLWALQNPDLVRRMAAEGHRLINHTWDHGSFTGFSPGTRPLSRAERWSQLDRTEALLVELTGQSTLPFFRSPYGDVDATVQRDIGARGYAYNVLWSVDSGGWRGYPARVIIDICLRNAHPGAIYVMHVGAAAQDGPALPAIIAGLAAAGYDFETIDEILSE